MSGRGEGGNPAAAPSAAGLTVLQREALAGLCQRYAVRRLALFGSAAQGDFDPATSDFDLAVDFSTSPDLSPARQYFDFKQALETLYGRPVDLVELAAMPDSRLKRAMVRSQILLWESEAARGQQGSTCIS